MWQVGSRQVEVTAQALKRGSLQAAMVPKNEPKLLPPMPSRLPSTSGRASSQSATTCEASTQFGTETVVPMIRDSYWPGPSSESTPKPRASQRSPCTATLASLKPSMPGIHQMVGNLPPL